MFWRQEFSVTSEQIEGRCSIGEHEERALEVDEQIRGEESAPESLQLHQHRHPRPFKTESVPGENSKR